MDINIDGPIDGIQCSNIINQKYFLPTIFTSAYKDEETLNEVDYTNLFGYITKPFEPEDVQISLKIALKMLKLHNEKIETPICKNKVELSKDIYFDKTLKKVFEKNIIKELTKKELHLLEFFSNNYNQTLSYEQLKINIWSNNIEISNSTIRDTVSRLKKTLPSLVIDNVKGIGYILKK